MKNLNVKGAWVLVTGAASGLGREMALELARHGANVLISDRSASLPELLLLEMEIRQKGVEVDIFEADLLELFEVEGLCESAEEKGVIAVICNAGVTEFEEHIHVPTEKMREILQVNLLAPAVMAARLGPGLAVRSGQLMLISSLAGEIGLPKQVIYSTSKSGLDALAKGLRAEWNGSGAGITLFLPGGIDTPMLTETGIAEALPPKIRKKIMTARVCAEYAIEALIRRKWIVVPGADNLLQRWGARLFPWIARRALRRVYGLEPAAKARKRIAEETT